MLKPTRMSASSLMIGRPANWTALTARAVSAVSIIALTEVSNSGSCSNDQLPLACSVVKSHFYAGVAAEKTQELLHISARLVGPGAIDDCRAAELYGIAGL